MEDLNKNNKTEEKKEKFVLFAISYGDEEAANKSLDELALLIDTAGATEKDRLIQNRDIPEYTTYFGKGKIDELKMLLWDNECDGIVCDDELSPVQAKNLEEALDTKVLDRTQIILDIFAKHASTSEGKLQVELAMLKYRLSRLTGAGKSMSRLGGGIGTRGPGEKKLETDRRLINKRVARLRKELMSLQAHRDVTRVKRIRNNIPTIAIVGYTNAGKSTLINKLTNSDILAKDKLFATLDPTTRNLKLHSGQEVIITDTVGFINKLPHNLIDAFRSTLEEAKYADIIFHVVDASSKDRELQMQVVYNTLEVLGIMNKTVITLFNKCDKFDDYSELRDTKASKSLIISAKEDIGIENVKMVLEDILRKEKIFLERLIPYKEASNLSIIRSKGEIIQEDYRNDGIYIKAYVPKEIYGRCAGLIDKESL
ncbi:GTP-binding protein HflX [Acetitomaculum ruminis DSM 5522]|uniref:GTPase HflX n=1 Tax=Acetitomaculum ruminis DSM 5522 TaxID=1120918 RepID=A0A1I1A930_9FIRM|nr:GTPase HflX [Acetitomaculum ruminis]SFB34499.1 GTP-binding protein HflX [Acetitomaculum ruminis DSM 5522]